MHGNMSRITCLQATPLQISTHEAEV